MNMIVRFRSSVAEVVVPKELPGLTQSIKELNRFLLRKEARGILSPLK